MNYRKVQKSAESKLKNTMDRQSKIEYLKKLAAGKLAPADLLRKLQEMQPPRVEFFMQQKDGKFNGMTREELENYRSGEPGRIHRYLITRRSCANATGNDHRELSTSD